MQRAAAHQRVSLTVEQALEPVQGLVKKVFRGREGNGGVHQLALWCGRWRVALVLLYSVILLVRSIVFLPDDPFLAPLTLVRVEV